MADNPGPGQSDRLAPADLFPWMHTKTNWLRSRTFWLLAGVAVLAALLLGEDANPQLLIDSLAAIILITYVLVLRHFLRSDISLLTLGGVFLFVVLLMKMPLLPVPGEPGFQAPMWLWLWFWRDLLPGEALAGAKFLPFDWLRQFASNFFSAGLAEDSFKILPVGMAILARRWLLTRPADQVWAGAWAKRLDMSRPTTLLMVCFASAAAFVYIETVGQYVPNQIAETLKSLLARLQGLPADDQLFFASQAGIVQGLQLLVPRLLRFLLGHGAYAAVAGFGLVLALRHPRHAPRAIISLMLASACLHGAWNTFSDTDLLKIPLGLAAGFAMLTVCLRCMELDREGNYLSGSAIGESIAPQRRPPPAPNRAAAPASSPLMAQRVASPPAPAAPPPPLPIPPDMARLAAGELPILGALVIMQGSGPPLTVLLRAGARIAFAGAAPHLPQLAQASLEIMVDPAQPSRLGLKNTGIVGWDAQSPDGRAGRVEPGRVMALVTGAQMEIEGVKLQVSLIAPG